MTVATVRTVATSFLTADAPGVLAIKGAWGVGKTYAWHQIVLAAKSKIALPKYCYVSLFGISSLSDLRLAIFANTEPVKTLGQKLDARAINDEWAALGGRFIKRLTALFSQTANVPYVKNVSVSLDSFAQFFIRGAVICLDDFERLSTSISSDELLGFISHLKEEKGCKVVFIFNEGELGDKKTVLARYREKVIDIELLFAPSTTEAIDLAFPQNMTLRELHVQCAGSLDIRNIRVLRKIVELTNLVGKELTGLHPGVMEQAVTTLVLVAWAYYEAGGIKPTMDYIKNWNRMMFSFSQREKKGEVSPEEKQWGEILTKYNLLHMDELDLALCKVVEQGHVEETGLARTARDLDMRIRAAESENSFSESWKLFHNTFEDNEDELVQALSTSLKRSAKQVTPINLNGTLKLLRELGRDDLAHEALDAYMHARHEELNLFDLDSYPFAGEITDTELKERFAKRYSETQILPTLLEALSNIAKQQGWSANEEAVLKRASEDDFYKLFKGYKGENLGRLAMTALRLDAQAPQPIASPKARAALERIGRECKINAIRVFRHGVKIEGDQPDPPQGERVYPAKHQNPV